MRTYRRITYEDASSRPGGSTMINAARTAHSLGHLTPNEFAAQRQVIEMAEEAVCSS